MKKSKEQKIQEVIAEIEKYTYQRGDSQCREINSEFCSKCAEFVEKLRRMMRKI